MKFSHSPVKLSSSEFAHKCLQGIPNKAECKFANSFPAGDLSLRANSVSYSATEPIVFPTAVVATEFRL